MFDKLPSACYVIPIATRKEENNMSNLIQSYKRCPTGANRRRLAAYLVKHPFALCAATNEEMAFLRVNEFI
jgi:hypothetical protein